MTITKIKKNDEHHGVIIFFGFLTVVFWIYAIHKPYLWIGALLGTIIGAWMASNARDRGYDKVDQSFIFFAGFLFSVFALIIWFLVRKTKVKK